MTYMRDASAIRGEPRKPPVPISPPRRPIAKDVAQRPAAKPRATDWREVMRAGHRRAEAIADVYRDAGRRWGKSVDVNPFAEPGEREHQAQREAGTPSMGSCYETMMGRYDAAVAPLRAAQEKRDEAAARKSVADAKLFHDQQIARNERFAAEMKAAANEQWRHK